MLKVRALIVEDNDNWQFIIREGLISCECDVDAASTYSEATRRLQSTTYDMVTLDMALSETEDSSGRVNTSHGWLFLVSQIRKLFPGPAVFVISGSFQNQPQRVFDMHKKYQVQGFMDKNEFDPLSLEKWVEQVRSFKEAGGRPDLIPRSLLDTIDNNQSGEMVHKLQDLFERQATMTQKRAERTRWQQELLATYEEILARLRKNKADTELQKATHGAFAPPYLTININDYEHEIRRIEEEIAKLTQGSSE